MLIATNHLASIRGSEVVAFETAQYFAESGCRVSVFTNWAMPPMAQTIEAVIGARVITDPNRVRPFTHDIVYVQHQVLGLFDYRPCPEDREVTFIAAGRLARRTYLESGGWLHDRILVDHVLANSELTAEHLAAIGHDGPITNFRNAAPAAFMGRFHPRPAAPRRVLVVTNHRDPALMEAIEILRRSTAVEHVGNSGERTTLVTPAMIADADLIISIGKTIPYALAARVPVYVYDHFGGPGYLDAGNVAAALRANFSGRCCRRKLSGADIAAEVMTGFARGVAFARDAPQAWIDLFHLPRYLDLLFEPPRMSNAEKRRRMAEHPFLAQERMLASHVRESYIGERRLVRSIAMLDQRLRESAADGASG